MNKGRTNFVQDEYEFLAVAFTPSYFFFDELASTALWISCVQDEDHYV